MRPWQDRFNQWGAGILSHNVDQPFCVGVVAVIPAWV